MPPKQRFNKESILEKAYEVFQSSGFNSVTARSVANALNCSTQPVFSYIATMNDVRSGIIKKAEEELRGAEGAIRKLGGEVKDICSFRLPNSDERKLVLVEKTKATPKKYPRKAGTPAKAPLC